MSRSKPPARSRRQSGVLGPLVAMGVVGGLIYHFESERREEVAAYEAQEAATRAERTRLFRTETLGALLEHCQKSWTYELNFYARPLAVAWSRERLDGYFLQGVDAGSWRRLGCDVAGVHLGPRVERPFIDGLPAEAEPGMDEVIDDGLARALAAVEGSRLDGDLLAVEIITTPRTGEPIVRRWRGLERGAQAEVEPADAPAFGSLVAGAPFPTLAGEPSPVAEVPRHRWLDEPELAFEIIESVLPSGATIAEIDLREEKIEISIEHPTPAFDGKPPARFGDMDVDDSGVPERTWWYPREDPGFGCNRGRPLAEVRAEFAEARARAHGRLYQAWYACSPAYSDGRRGTWHVRGEDDP